MSADPEYDVVIVGGGPTGLNLALTLCTNGVNPSKILIIEKRSEIKNWCKAGAIQPRSMELFYSISDNLINSILSRAIIGENLSLGSYDSNTKPLYMSTKNKIDSKFDYITCVEQWHTETCLSDELKNKYNIQLRRGVELLDFNDNKTYITLTLRDQTSSTTNTISNQNGINSATKDINDSYNVKTRYLIGCDGGRSPIRTKLSIDFPGISYNESYGIIECQFELCDPPVGAVYNKNDEKLWADLASGQFKGLLIRAGGRANGDGNGNGSNDDNSGNGNGNGPELGGEGGWIFAVSLPEGKAIVGCIINPNNYHKHKNIQIDPKTGQKRVLLSVDEWNQVFAQRGLSGIKVKGEPIWNTTIIVNDKQAVLYGNENNIFLCGDACHVHSPYLGQGMNMGLQDSNNLGWKLALVCQNICNDNLLNSYQCERRAIDKDILQAVHQGHLFWSSMASPNFRNKAYIVANFINLVNNVIPFAIVKGIRTVFQLGYTYRNSKQIDPINSLNMEYWIRPSLLSFRILHNMFIRRNQNIRRVFGNGFYNFLKAGDRCSNVIFTPAEAGIDGKDDMNDNIKINDSDDGNDDINGIELYKLFRKCTFVVILFEGYSQYTEKKYYKNMEELESIKKEILDNYGHIGGKNGFIEVMVVRKENYYLNEMFGILGQCMYLVRKDHYIGLRSEPISMKALKYYLVNKMHVSKIRYNHIYDRLEDYTFRYKYIDFMVPIVFGVVGVIVGTLADKKYNWTRYLPKVSVSITWPKL